MQKIQHKKQELGKGVFLALSCYSTVFRTILLYEENSVYIEEDQKIILVNKHLRGENIPKKMINNDCEDRGRLEIINFKHLS